MDIEDSLRKAIADSGMTHYAIGKAAGIATGMIDRFVRGDRGIQLGTASKIARVLGYGLVKVQPGTTGTAKHRSK